MATAKFPTHKVIKWCEDTMKRITEQRKELIQERVEYYMTPTKFLGFTISKGMSYEEAMEYANCGEGKTFIDEMDDDFAFRYNRERYSHALKLKQMCERINEYPVKDDKVIELTSEDIRKLYIYVD